MSVKHALSLTELSPETITCLIRRGLAFASGDLPNLRSRANAAVGLYFRRSSTRTRTAFALGAMKLGASTIVYGPNDLQLCTGESVEDTARVLSGFLDVLVIRTNDSLDEMRAFANQNKMAVINAMSREEHPTQAIADLIMLSETFGGLAGLHVLYIGEGNNTAASLSLAISKTPRMRLTLVTPEGYGLTENVLGQAQSFAIQTGASVEQHHDLSALPRNVDAVYATRWQTMGDPKPEPTWRDKFEPYKVTAELMAHVSKPSGTIFMHDLPSLRENDVTNEVLDGPQSRAFRQAQHKLSGAMAVLDWCLNGQ
jgi:ornithine carbamoyltransferase